MAVFAAGCYGYELCKRNVLCNVDLLIFMLCSVPGRRKKVLKERRARSCCASKSRFIETIPQRFERMRNDTMKAHNDSAHFFHC